MTDAAGTPPTGSKTAGMLLREARQAQGMHIAMLAAATKVSQRKLEALEADRLDELPDATFTRALAQTVCRALKMDPAPVLALLPPPPGQRLEAVGEGLNAPFRDRPGRDTGGSPGWVISPAVLAPAVVLLLAAAVYFLPPGTIGRLEVGSAASAPATVASAPLPAAPVVAPPAAMAPPAADAAMAAASAPAPAASMVSETVALAPQLIGDGAASAPAGAAAAVAGVLVLRVSNESWIEVTDSRGTTLLSRNVQPGESVGLDGVMPMRLVIGNVGGTQVVFRGKPFDLAAYTRDNVARLDLK